MRTPIHRYINGQPYSLAAGRDSHGPGVIDRLAKRLAIIDLDQARPQTGRFLRVVQREMKIRNYAAKTRKSYRGVVVSVLRWFGRPAHLLGREHVREYLEYLFDGGMSGQTLAVHLSAIRTIWDKFCFRDVTLGLETPRRRRKRPVILSRSEICRLLAAAPSCRDTLLIGLMYGAGLRVSEVCRIRWNEIDFDRNQIFVSQGKGNADRHVQLPHQFKSVLARLRDQRPERQSYVFPSESITRPQSDRYISVRTVQRLVKLACRIAGITKPATPHSLRHAFATHSFEDGCDIRLIQKVLGHARIDTTTIYVTVAKEQTRFQSPIDRLAGSASDPSLSSSPPSASPSASPSGGCPPQPASPVSVGQMRLHIESLIDPTSLIGAHSENQPSSATRSPRASNGFPQAAKSVTIDIIVGNQIEVFRGTIAQMQRPGFLKIDLPPQEAWADGLSRLPAAVQERMQQPEFYLALQLGLLKRLDGH